MVPLSKEQRRALKRLYDRTPLYHEEVVNHVHLKLATTYRHFRKQVQPMFGGQGCVLIKWCGMWVGIERDGYTHT